MKKRFWHWREDTPNTEREQMYLDSGHDWEADENGYIDIFAGDSYDTHNGPKCLTCGYNPCWHCERTPTICKGA